MAVVTVLRKNTHLMGANEKRKKKKKNKTQTFFISIRTLESLAIIYSNTRFLRTYEHKSDKKEKKNRKQQQQEKC